MIEIITIGDELTCGRTADENARFIGEALYLKGFAVSRVVTVGDGLADISEALKGLKTDTRFAIITGGLGPTQDDKTAQAAAECFGKKLVLNEAAFSRMEKLLAKAGRNVSAVNKKQAILPEGCDIIANPVGTASGFLMLSDRKYYIFLPGVPGEVRAMTESFVLPCLEKKIRLKEVIASRTLKIFGLWESLLQEKLAGLFPEDGPVSLAYYPGFPEISLKIIGRGETPENAETILDRATDTVEAKVGDFVYSRDNESIEAVLGRLLTEKGMTVSVAESCTGGLISHRLTNIAGSSIYFERSVVVYSNRAKQSLLGIPAEVIQDCGAVSEAVAGLMAEGIRRISGTHFGLAVTGIAGPGGGTAAKPVGTVCIAVASGEKTEVKTHGFFFKDRERIKLMSAHMALDHLRRAILGIEQ